MEEIWKDIEGFEGLYQVSNMGNVRTFYKQEIDINTGRFYKIVSDTPILLKQNNDRYGYRCLNLCKDNKRKKYLIHRLVALAFIPNPENKPFIDHIDNNSLNNHISNLRWATFSENSMNQKTQTRTRSSKYKGVFFQKRRNHWISRIRKDYKSIHIGRYHSKILAAIAYDLKALELFGQYAKLNFPIIRVLKSKYS